MDTKKLRQKILDLAIHGKLVPQDPNDEPTSVLLERIRSEKEQLIKEGKIKAPKKSKTAGDTSHYENESLFDIPRGWSWCKLYDVCIFESGFAFKSASYRKSGVPLVRISNIQDNAIALDECVYIQESVDSRYHIQKGDLLIALSGATTGKMGVYQYSDDALLNQRVGNLRVISPNCFIPEYRNLFLSSKEDEILKKAWGGAQPNISPSTIYGFDIPLPPVNEQSRIVLAVSKCMSIVDFISREGEEIEASIDKAKVKILELAIHGKLVPQNPADEPALELLKRVNPTFKPSDNLHYGESLPTGWICATYGTINQHKNRSINPMDSPKEMFELYSVPIYETGCPEYLSGKAIGSTKQAVEKGDVLLCKINPHLNRAWAVEHYNPKLKCIASSEWLVFQSDALYPDYARLFFMSPSFRSLMLSNVSGVGGSLMRARASAVDGYPIWVPPIDEQKRIVKVVKAYYKILNEVVAGLN